MCTKQLATSLFSSQAVLVRYSHKILILFTRYYNDEIHMEVNIITMSSPMTRHIWQVIGNYNTSPLHLHNITLLARDQQKRICKKEEEMKENYCMTSRLSCFKQIIVEI